MCVGWGSYHKGSSKARSRQRPTVHSGMSLSSTGANQETRGRAFTGKNQSKVLYLLSCRFPQKTSCGQKALGRPGEAGPRPPRGGVLPAEQGPSPQGRRDVTSEPPVSEGSVAPVGAHSSGLPEPGHFCSRLFILLHLNQAQS